MPVCCAAGRVELFYANPLHRSENDVLLKAQTTMEIVICILAVSLVLIGLAGTILPMLPGVPLVFAGLLLAAWSNRFESVGWPVLAVLALLALLSVLVDFTASSLGAKRVGASRAAILGAGLGAGFGMFLGLPGLLLGP